MLVASTASPLVFAKSDYLVVAQADQAEIEFWRSVKNSNDASEFEAYLKAYPNGKFAPLARLRLKKLNGATTKPATKKAAGTRPARRATKSPKMDLYTALDLFGDVLERVRRDYVKEVDDAKIIKAAISGGIERFPSAKASQIARELDSETCRKQTKDAIYACLNVAGKVFDAQIKEYPGKAGELVEAAIDRMLASLDSHSNFLNAIKLKETIAPPPSNFGGIGTEVTMEGGLVKVVAPLDDTPAYKAGIQAGDLMTHLDDNPVQGMNLQQAVDIMRGEAGTPIKITLKRAGVDVPIPVNVTRAKISIKPVKWRVEGEIGYIRIASFYGDTGSLFNKAVSELERKLGPRLKGFILDLRNCPGGVLSQVEAVADAMLEAGTIVSIKGGSSATQRKNAKAGDVTRGRKIVVLINRGAASGAEVLAGALKDHKRAKLVGTRSFGKGSIQTIIPLADKGALRLTTAHMYTPAGHLIESNGIDPDFVVEQVLSDSANTQSQSSVKKSSVYVPRDGTTDTQLQFAIRYLNDQSGLQQDSPAKSAVTKNREPNTEKLESLLKELEKLE